MRLAVVLIALAMALSSTSADVSCGFVTQRVQCGDLGCDTDRNICIPCRSAEDCYPQAMTCSDDSKCVVRSFFSLFSFRTFMAMLGALVVCSIGVVAGVGGGGILVPMFTAFIQLPMQSAVGLSQSTICGQSTLNMYFAVQAKFPDTTWDRPLINYQYLGLLLPLGLIGTLIGGIVSKVCPDVLRLVLLFLLLSLVLYRTVVKMRKQYEEDKQVTDVVVTDACEEGQAGGSTDAAETQSREGGDNEGAAQTPASAAKAAQPQYPTFELGLKFGCFGVLLFFNILRTLCACGGFWYWLCVFAPLAALSYAFYFYRCRLEAISKEHPEQLTFAWNEQNTVTYPLAAVIAGAAAAMLGIGGGLVLGFVLYEVGLIPEEASVTGGMATFFIAFSSALQLLVTGHLVVDFGIVFFLVGLGSTSIGQFVLMKYIKDHGLRYLIVGALAFIVGGSLVVLGGFGIYDSVMSVKRGGSPFAFGRLCNI